MSAIRVGGELMRRVVLLHYLREVRGVALQAHAAVLHHAHDLAGQHGIADRRRVDPVEAEQAALVRPRASAR